MRFLVTAGGTREMIDSVRDWGNIFTGQTGLLTARALAPLGKVDLLTSNPLHDTELQGAENAPIEAVRFTGYQDLRAALEARMAGNSYDAVFMTAAVADYLPAGAFEIIDRAVLPSGEETWRVRNVSAAKIKSGVEQIAFSGSRSEKLIDMFRSRWGYRGLLVKFKLEVGIDKTRLLEIGRASRIASGADYLVANTLEMVRGTNPGAYLIGESSEQWIARDQLPSQLADIVRHAKPR